MYALSTHCVLALAVGFVWLLHPVIWTNQAAEEEPLPARLKRLQQERIVTLQRAVDILAQQSAKGAVDENQVAQTHVALTDAICEGATSQAERIGLLTQQCADLTTAHKAAKGRFEGGVCSEFDLCQMRAALLRTQIQLLKEQSQTPEHAESPDGARPEARIRQLQQERIDTLQRAVEVLRSQFDRGVVDIGSVFRQEAALADARLELAKSRAERIELRTAQCRAFGVVLEFEQARFEMGIGNELHVLPARADCLYSQIRLVQAQLEPVK